MGFFSSIAQEYYPAFFVYLRGVIYFRNGNLCPQNPTTVLTHQPKTIDEVIAQLDEVIDETVADNNYLGIFAYVYRRTTAEIRKAIEEKRFEDNERMERFDVAFANYYLDAYKKFKANEAVSKSWMTSFEVRHNQLSIMQHLILGMNAHINLDLGVTAGLFSKNEPIDDLKHDFMLVNDILAELTEEMQSKIARNSIMVRILDKIAKHRDEQVANFSIVKARQQAWNFACNLAKMSKEQQAIAISNADLLVADIGKIVIEPKSLLIKKLHQLINFFEEKDVRRIIQLLRA